MTDKINNKTESLAIQLPEQIDISFQPDKNAVVVSSKILTKIPDGFILHFIKMYKIGLYRYASFKIKHEGKNTLINYVGKFPPIKKGEIHEVKFSLQKNLMPSLPFDNANINTFPNIDKCNNTNKAIIIINNYKIQKFLFSDNAGICGFIQGKILYN